MSYIGQGLPTDTFSGFTTDSFSGDGSATTFTLSKAPFSEDGLIVVINNVIQQPTTNFTVSGTTLTIVGTAVATGNTIYAIHTSGAVPSTLASKVDVNGLSDGIILDADADTTISADTDDQIDFKAGGTDIMSLTATTATFNDGVTITTADNTDQLTLKSTDADAEAGPQLVLHRESGSPADNDVIGRVRFEGEDDASNKTVYAQFTSQIIDAGDGSGGSEDSTFQLEVFNNGALREIISVQGGTSGVGSIVFNDSGQNMDIRAEGTGNLNLLYVDAGVDSIYVNASAQVVDEKFLVNNNDNSKGLISRCTSGSQANDTVHFDANRAGSSAYNFVRIQSGNFSDSEFIISGEGNVNADGTFSGGGADYAEFFEWEDGNTSDEDRVGCSVVLDGNKIVKATDSDDASKIIGVISANPAVTGDSDIEQWLQKYEKDELSRFIWEDYESVIWYDENGKDTFYHVDRVPEDVTIPDNAIYYRTEDDGVTKLKRKKLNPAWDSSQTYVSRKDRKEWDTVGLMGKLRLKKGQPTGTNWIKMRDISETVEEWLVR
jgi:hypothetical protein